MENLNENVKEKKNGKGLIVLVVVLSLLLCGTIGYICYDKFLEEKEVVDENGNDNVTNQNDTFEEMTADEFYSLDNLVNKNYIEKVVATKAYDYSKNVVMEIRDGKLYSADNLDKVNLTLASEVVGAVKSVAFVEYGMTGMGNMFYALTENGDLYYASVSENSTSGSRSMTTFKKINPTKVVDLYNFVSDENILYPDNDGVVLANYEDGQIMVVFQEKFDDTIKSYVATDLIYGYFTSMPGGLFISYDKYLVEFDENNNVVKLEYNGAPVRVKDGFGVVDSSYNETYYAIGYDNKLYEITSDDRKFEVKLCEEFEDLKVTSYEYLNQSNKRIEVWFSNETGTLFDNTTGFSTLHYRNK